MDIMIWGTAGGFIILVGLIAFANFLGKLARTEEAKREAKKEAEKK